jgi:predicted O-methyltransferase YrrM
MTHEHMLDIVHPAVEKYIGSLTFEADPQLMRLAVYAKEHGFPAVGYLGGYFCDLLTRMIGGRRVFEFGSGFGYSAYFFARAVGPEGEVHGSETEPKVLSAHRELFQNHTFASRIHLHEGPGVEVLAKLPGLFDVVFIDLNKDGYIDALEAAIPRVRTGGIILADNVLWSGRTSIEPEPGDIDALSLREYNKRVHADPRLHTGIIPCGDGLSVSLKLGA